MQENSEAAKPEITGETGAGQPKPEKDKTSRRTVYTTIATVLVLAALFIPLAWQETQAAVIAPGDHGRDMYLYDQVAHGKKYLRDFKYIYGPLSLEIYGLAFRIGGSSIRTALVTRAILLCILVALAFWAYRRYASAVPAGVAALLTGAVHFPFWHTFNHIVTSIGIVLFIGAIAPWFKKQPEKRDGNGSWKSGLTAAALPALGVFIVFTSKCNMGVALLAGTAVYFTIEKLLTRIRAKRKSETPIPFLPRRRIWLLFAISMGAVFLFYGYYFISATTDNIYHSFRLLFAKGQNFGNPIKSFLHVFLNPIGASYCDGVCYAFLAEVFVLAGGFAAFAGLMLAAKPGKRDIQVPRRPAAFILLLLLFLIHEWMIIGNRYPLAYFGAPPSALLIAIALDRSIAIGGWEVRAGYRSALRRGYLPLAAVGLGLVINTAYVIKQRASQPETMLTMQRGKGFILLPPDIWPEPLKGKLPDGSTVILPPHARDIVNPANAWNRIYAFIEENVPAGEPVLTLPYMPVHNFLSKRPFPVGYLDFLEISGIKERHEREVIEIMKKAPVRLVLIENRGFFLSENGIGRINETCPTLFAFIQKDYELVGALGDFDTIPTWAGNHGVAVFWRKSVNNENEERIKEFKRELTPAPEKLYKILKLTAF